MTSSDLTSVGPAPAADSDAVMAFVMRAVDELGSALNVSLVVMGDRLGFYRSLAGDGPATPRRACRPYRYR